VAAERRLSEGPDQHAATLRAFVAAAGAAGAMLVLDLGPDAPPLLVDVAAGEAASGEPAPGPIPHVHPLSPPEVDAERAELTAPMGAIAMAARAGRGLPGPQCADRAVGDDRRRRAADHRGTPRRGARHRARGAAVCPA
jgi:hypothetical protein